MLRLVGKGRWPGNPAYCRGCFQDLYTHRLGAEVECTLFFADVRGSTTLAERIGPSEFRHLLERFYAVATRVLVDHEAVVDKYVGDEVVAIFVPAMAGNDHPRRAVDAALALLHETGHDDDHRPWIPIGIGVNTGVAFVGAVGTAEHVEFTALGDAVNVSARLATEAGPGELLITEATATAAGVVAAAADRRSMTLRGRSEVTDVVVLGASAAARP
jgi:adenylate cyclase